MINPGLQYPALATTVFPDFRLFPPVTPASLAATVTGPTAGSGAPSPAPAAVPASAPIGPDQYADLEAAGFQRVDPMSGFFLSGPSGNDERRDLEETQAMLASLPDSTLADLAMGVGATLTGGMGILPALAASSALGQDPSISLLGVAMDAMRRNSGQRGYQVVDASGAYSPQAISSISRTGRWDPRQGYEVTSYGVDQPVAAAPAPSAYAETQARIADEESRRSRRAPSTDRRPIRSDEEDRQVELTRAAASANRSRADRNVNANRQTSGNRSGGGGNQRNYSGNTRSRQELDRRGNGNRK